MRPLGPRHPEDGAGRPSGKDGTDPPAADQEALTMEYLVTMTTRVPDGTTEAAVDEVRAREAAHSRELAAQGHLLRLWRPPLQPGEWRTLGLFAAGDASELEQVLASMPLRIWRTDEVTALAPHPHDPGRPQAAAGAGQAEFLTTFTRAVPPGTPDEAVRDADAGEAERAAELGRQGHLLRLWQVPSQGNSLGQWRAADPAEMQALLKTLPLDPYMTVDTTPLTPHPSDPAAAG
jgi:muconolactone delta-isomerase